eukprot:2016462-Alexandrium_andersonii.AAC.1
MDAPDTAQRVEPDKCHIDMRDTVRYLEHGQRHMNTFDIVQQRALYKYRMGMSDTVQSLEPDEYHTDTYDI